MKKINLTEYIRKSAAQVALSESERERMKRVLSEYMAMKPMRNAPLERRAPLSYMFLSVYSFSKRSVAAVLIAGILFSGAGVSFAAESALPGDALYPIKVDVNEPVVAAFSVSSESKTLWNAERAERRLEEAAKLAFDNKLTASVEDELLARFEAHAEEAVSDVERLEEEDSSAAIDIASRFEDRLLAHEVVLEDVRNTENVRQLKDRVELKTARLAKIGKRGRLLADVSAAVATAAAPAPEVSLMMSSEAALPGQSGEPAGARTAAKGVSPDSSSGDTEGISESVRSETVVRLARTAEKELENMEKLLERMKNKISPEVLARISEDVAGARSLVTEAQRTAREGDFGSAFNFYRSSLNISAKLSVFMKAFQKSRIQEIPESSREPRSFEDEKRNDSNDNEVKSEEHDSEDREGSSD